MSDEQDDVLSKLTILERRFAEAYAGECKGNGVRSCQAAGYAGDYGTLATTASRLLKKAQIREYLSSLTENDPLVMSRIERQRRLSSIARGEYTETRFDGEGNPIEVNPPARDIIAAVKELGLVSGDYISKVAQVDSQGNDVKGMTLAELVVLAGMGKVGE